MASISHKFFLLLVFFITFISSSTSTPKIGVTINHYPSSITPQTPLSSIINLHKFTAVRLVDPTPHLLRSFSNSSISVHLIIPNSRVPALATNRSIAAVWVLYHVVPFYPYANITAISVGSNTISSSTLALLAIRHIHYSLHDFGIREIRVSTSVSVIHLLSSVFPPSSSKFIEPHKRASVIPLLKFLKSANSSLFVNLYPYDLYLLNQDIVLGFALFQDSPFSYRDDPFSGVRYHNLFDSMVDAVLSAMSREGYGDIPLIITETGWPSSSGGSENSDANKVYAQMYLRGLIDHLKYGGGSTLKKDKVSEVFIYELFDDDSSVIATKWGILHSNFSKKYHDFTLPSYDDNNEEDVWDFSEVKYDWVGNKSVKRWMFWESNTMKWKLVQATKAPMVNYWNEYGKTIHKWLIRWAVLFIFVSGICWIFFPNVFEFPFPVADLGNGFEVEEEADFDGVQEAAVDGVAAALDGQEQGAVTNNGDDAVDFLEEVASNDSDAVDDQSNDGDDVNDQEEVASSNGDAVNDQEEVAVNNGDAVNAQEQQGDDNGA